MEKELSKKYIQLKISVSYAEYSKKFNMMMKLLQTKPMSQSPVYFKSSTSHHSTAPVLLEHLISKSEITSKIPSKKVFIFNIE